MAQIMDQTIQVLFQEAQYHNSSLTAIFFLVGLCYPFTGNVAITRGSTAVIVLLCILGLVCLGGTCARHKHWSWQSSSSNSKSIYNELQILCTDIISMP